MKLKSNGWLKSLPSHMHNLFLGLMVVLAVTVVTYAQDKFNVTTVYLVRHAEKAAAPAANPPLLEVGVARAQALVNTLAKAQIKTIITSQFLRTKQTAEPLAKQLGITITEIPVAMSAMNSKEISPDYYRQMLEKIYAADGAAVLVVGHSNTMPEIIKALGGDIVPTIDDKEYEDLFVVTVYAKGKAKVANLKQ